jgi:uncharacterized protein YeaO (DUF488 family)
MKTSYFAIQAKNPDAVSISRWPPRWWGKGRRYIALAPSADLLTRYRDGKITWAGYCREYRAQLATLDPAEIHAELKGKTLCCVEKDASQCHRRLVAEWLERSLGVKVPES